MFRTPFVWNVQVRREALEAELVQLRELPYSLWRDMLGRPMAKRTTARDRREYLVKTVAEWVGNDSENIRVTVVLESPGLRRQRMCLSFVITPDNQFVV